MSFIQMPAHSKVWVYASNKILTDDTVTAIKKKAEVFINNWTAHENKLAAGFDIFYNCFLVIGVDEKYNAISGCGIDKSVEFIRQTEKEFELNLFDRKAIRILQNEQLIITNKLQVEDFFESGLMDENTTAFNNSITTKAEFDNFWKITIKSTWYYSSINKKPVTI